MAIFGKPPGKKTPPAKPANHGFKREAHVVSARELAAQAANRAKAGKPLGLEPLGETSLRGASIIDWSTAPKAIEVAQANPGLCAVLENAALLFANAQDVAARELLEQGVQTDQDTKLSPLAWLALFDLMQRANDRVAVVGRAHQGAVRGQVGRGRIHRDHRQAVRQQRRTARRFAACAREVRAAGADRSRIGHRLR